MMVQTVRTHDSVAGRVALTLASLALLLTLPTDGWAQKWAEFARSEAGLHLLDRDSVWREDDTVRAWVRTEYSREGRSERIREDRKLRGIAYSQALYVVDCARRTVAVASESDYDKSGRALRHGDPGGEADVIPPGSMADLLAGEMCRKPGPDKAGKPSRSKTKKRASGVVPSVPGRDR